MIWELLQKNASGLSLAIPLFHGLLSRRKEAPSPIETGVVKRMKDILSASQVAVLSPIHHSFYEVYLAIRSSRSFASVRCRSGLVAWMRD